MQPLDCKISHMHGTGAGKPRPLLTLVSYIVKGVAKRRKEKTDASMSADAKLAQHNK